MSFPYSDFDSGGGVSGVTQTLLNSKQDVLNVDGQPINTTVLNSFTIGGSEQNNETNSLVTASALENWFEAIQGTFIKVGANPSSGVRVGTIQNPPSTTDVPSCSAVVNHVTSKLTPINNQITALSNDKVDKSSVVSTLTASNLTSTNLVTEGGILNFVGNHLTESSVPVVKIQPRLHRKVSSEITDPEFSFIRNDVYDIDSGFDESINDALATMACTNNHIIDQISENKFGINLNLMSVEFSLPVGNAGWSVLESEIPDPDITYLQQVAIEDSAQLTIIRLESDGDNYIYTPSKIQQLALPSNSAWLQNLPSNVNVIHANALTGFIYVLGSTDTELDINWSIPIETKVANDIWTGVSYAIPTNHRVLAYDHTTKGVCVLVRSTDTTVYSNSSLTWFDLYTLKGITSTEIEAHTHTDVNFSRVFLRDIDMPFTPPINNQTVGLELMRADQTAFAPLLCSDVFIMGSPIPNTVTGLLAEKIDLPNPSFNLQQELDNKLNKDGNVTITGTPTAGNPVLTITGDSTPTAPPTLVVDGNMTASKFTINGALQCQSIAIGNPPTGIAAGVDLTVTSNSSNLVYSGSVHQFVTDNYAPIDSPTFTGPVIIPELEFGGATFTSTRANSFATQSFEAFKTSATEILGDAIPEPISCTAYTNAGSLAVISPLDANNYHTLSPNGANIHSHLTSNYVPIPATGGGAKKCVIRNANDDGWTFSATNIDVDYRTDDITTAADWKIPSVLAVKNYALTEFIPDFSVTRNSVGNYTITFGTTQLIHYCISLTTETIITGGNGVGTTQHLDDYQIVYHSKASTGFGVYVKEQDDATGNGTFRDCKWDFICVSRGKIFSHGSVNGFTGAKVNLLL